MKSYITYHLYYKRLITKYHAGSDQQYVFPNPDALKPNL